MKVILCMVLVLSPVLAACNRTAQTPMAQGGVSARQTPSEFDSRIPPPDLRRYEDVRDAKDWQNPYLVIHAEGVEVISKHTSVGRQIVSCDELAPLLESLPATAWPYGRVVAAQEVGIRLGDGKDERPVAENKARVERILTSLEVKVDWWPSA